MRLAARLKSTVTKLRWEPQAPVAWKTTPRSARLAPSIPSKHIDRDTPTPRRVGRRR